MVVPMFQDMYKLDAAENQFKCIDQSGSSSVLPARLIHWQEKC